MDNNGPNGDLNTDKLQSASIAIHQTGTPNCPLLCVSLADQSGTYIKPHNTWCETLAAREDALRNGHMRAAERWTENTKRLPPLKVGDFVCIQNQTGSHPLKWDKTGRVIKVKQFDQYRVYCES